VKQKQPKTVDETVSAILEMESYLVTSRVSQVEVEQQPTVVAVVQAQQGTMMEMMKAMMDLWRS
jgi:predicted GTPase